tara:strand:+ start:14842 stop:15576 length:735 start_codon:yes stop_codon:yes gene_type:complete
MRQIYKNFYLSKKTFAKLDFKRFAFHNIVLRYISFYFTPFFISFNPNQISYIRLFVAFLSLIILSYGYYFQGVLLFFISYIIDCIDGNIARIKNQASYYGKYFDGFGDSAVEIITPIALLFYFFDNFIYGNKIIIILSTLTVISSSLSYLIIDKTYNYIRWVFVETKKKVKSPNFLSNKFLIIFINILEDIKFISLFLSIFIIKPQMFLIYLISSLVLYNFRILGCIFWSRKYLNIKRTSSHSR